MPIHWFRQVPLSLKVPLLVAALMIGIAGIVSKLVLLRLEAAQAQHFQDLTEAYLDGLSTALMPATIRRDPWEAFDALDRSRSRYAAVSAIRVLVVLPDGHVLAASDPLRHPVGAAAPPEAQPAPVIVLDGASTWVHRPLTEGRVAVGRIAAEVDLSALLAERREAVLALLGVNAALTILFAGLGWLLVQRMLRPLFRLSARLARATDGRLEAIPEAELPAPHTAEGRAFRHYNAAAAAVADREALLARLAAEERRALVGRYASAMAHEVNNPLGGLFNAVRMIQRHGDDPVRRHRAAGLLERGLTGIHNIVRASLMLWRGEADPRPLTAHDVEDLRLLIESEAQRRELRLDWQVALQDGPLPPAQAFRQIALNLLLNACAASPPGALLRVRTASEADGLLLSVSDEGPGLPPEAAAILLGRHGDALPAAGGLGIWTIARLTRELGATVETAGPPGTTIIIRIPMPPSHASPPQPDPAPFVALVEDDPVMGQSIVDWLGVEGYQVRWFRSGAEAAKELARSVPDLLLCDIRLPDMTGEAVHTATGGGLPTIFITGHGDVAQAVRLMRAGAADYITKPFDIEALLQRIEQLLAPRWAATDGFTLGDAPAIRQVERMLRRVAMIDSTVLVTGPSGSGKEVAARFLHDEGPQAAAPFVALNCAAIPNELLESEIFGHERGAFTGAAQRHEGLAERAGAGTLFLDEVAELPPALQAKLLRLLQERSFRRVGGDRDLPMRARVLAATNADLTARMREGRFREDLFFRLSVISISMPPLCERAEDVLPLARRFLGEFGQRFGRAPRGFSTLAEEALTGHDFPGNIRELRNRVERAVALAEADWIGPGDLFPERMPQRARTAPAPRASLSEARDGAERRAILEALAATGGDVAQAALRLDVSRSTLFDKVKRLNIRTTGEESRTPD